MDDKNLSQEELISKLSKAQERITDLETQIDTLKSAEEKYRQIVENANSIILLMDVNGDITFFNKFAQRFFGFYESDILGKNVIGTIVSEKDLSGKDLVDMIRDIVENPERHSLNENENIRANGERVRILWTNKAIIGYDGTISGILCVGNQVVRPTC
ncbi:PAS domain-containing protein [bacterium]|nr:MAG: PAS domain-containing protein [bacterium]